MAATHALATIIAAATSNAASGTTTGTVYNKTAGYDGLVTIKLTNGATAPTIAANAYVYTSGDNFATAGKLFMVLPGDINASASREYAVDIPQAVMYVRVDVKDNTAQAVTCEAFIQVTTGI